MNAVSPWITRRSGGEITPTARVKAIRQNIEQLIQELEARRIYNVYADYRLECDAPALFSRFDSLKITHASCYSQQGTGKVHLTMPGTGGAVDEHGSALPAWVGEFLRHPARRDVLRKLQRSAAAERHAFLIATLTGAPWPVESYLMGHLDHIPSQAPDMPEPVTGVWVVSGMGPAWMSGAVSRHTSVIRFFTGRLPSDVLPVL